MAKPEWGTPWTVESPKNDSHAFDVYSVSRHKLHHGHWGGKEVAHVIAAAPEMYEAILDYLDAVSANTSLKDERKRQPGIEARFRAAIAKAEGRTP